MRRVTKITQSLDVHVSTIKQTIDQWRNSSTVATLPRCSQPIKMTVRTQRRILNEMKNGRVSAKDLNKSLAHGVIVDNIHCHQILNKIKLMG